MMTQNRQLGKRVTIQQLQYILEVNRVGTITQAAKNLFVSHSSVSNAIRALEEELGFAVFDRSRQGAVPTHLPCWPNSAVTTKACAASRSRKT